MSNLQNYLKESGFCSVALPDPDINPLQVVVRRQGRYERLPDKINKLFFEGNEIGLPVIKRNRPMPHIDGSLMVTSELSGSAGLLDGLITRLGLNFNAHVKASTDDRLVFVFESPQKDLVSSHVDLDAYLNDASVKKNSSFGEMLLNSEIFIITEVLKTTNFSIGVVDVNNLGAGVDISVQDLVEGEISFDRNREFKRSMAYKGELPVVFAAKIVKLKYDKGFMGGIFGKNGVFRIIDAPILTVRSEDEEKVDLLQEGNLMINL